MENNGKDMLQQVRILLEHRDDIQREFHRDILRLGREIDKGFEIRLVYFPISYITKKKDVRYYNPVLEPLKDILSKSQLNPNQVLEVETRGGETIKGKNYITRVAGGFPSRIHRDRLVIQGENPDIDSTCIASAILIDIALLMKEDLNKSVSPIVKQSLRYLFKKEFKITGLLMQGPGEDWAYEAGRDGIVTYSNLMYLMLLEKSINLFISLGEKQMLSIIREKMSRLIDSMSRYLWYNNYFINLITPYGAADLTYMLDTIIMAETESYSKDDKVITHINTLHNALSTEEGLLKLNTPYSYNPNVKKIKMGEYLNGGIWIPLNILYAYTYIINNDISKGVDLLNKLIKYREYQWIDSTELKKGEKGARLINNSLILRSIDTIIDILKREKLLEKL